MTNEQFYKTPEERAKAHRAYCKENTTCPILDDRGTDTKCTDCAFNWLALPCEDEEPMRCPYCGDKINVVNGPKTPKTPYMTFAIKCANGNCGYSSCIKVEKSWAIAAHNRVCRAMKAAKKGETK